MPDLDFSQRILLLEYERMCTEIRSIESNIEKAIGFGMSVITISFAVGIAQHVDQIFFLVPLAIVGVFLYANLLYMYIFSMGGYKSFLEDRLNAIAGTKILLWERLVQERQKHNFLRPVLFGIYSLTAAVLIFVSIQKISEPYGWVVGGALLAVGLLLLVIVVLSVIWVRQIYGHIYQRANELYKAG